MGSSTNSTPEAFSRVQSFLRSLVSRPTMCRAGCYFTLWSTGPAWDRHARKGRHPCPGRGRRPGWDVDPRLPRTTIWCPLHLDLDPGRGYEVRVPGLSCRDL